MFTTNAKEAEVEWFYNNLQELPELIPKKKKKNEKRNGRIFNRRQVRRKEF